MANVKYIVRIGTGAAAVYVVKIRSFAEPSRGNVASETTKDKDEARTFTIEQATAIAQRNEGEVVEVIRETVSKVAPGRRSSANKVAPKKVAAKKGSKK